MWRNTPKLLSATTLQRQLVALRKSQHHDQQLTYLKTAVDAMNDVWGGRYKKGHPKNVRNVAKVRELITVSVRLFLFTSTRSFYPSTSSASRVRADSSPQRDTSSVVTKLRHRDTTSNRVRIPPNKQPYQAENVQSRCSRMLSSKVSISAPTSFASCGRVVLVRNRNR